MVYYHNPDCLSPRLMLKIPYFLGIQTPSDPVLQEPYAEATPEVHISDLPSTSPAPKDTSDSIEELRQKLKITNLKVERLEEKLKTVTQIVKELGGVNADESRSQKPKEVRGGRIAVSL